MKSNINLSTTEIQQLNPQVLAFIGDGVYSLFIRTEMLKLPKNKSNFLHAEANKFVSAVGQSIATQKVIPILTAEEVSIFKRARNYKTTSVAKNSTLSEYKKATGLEAVIGYLYLSDEQERLQEIMSLCMEAVNESRG